MKGSELVVKALQQHGVDTVFGYPGGAIMPIYDALYGSGLKHILCRQGSLSASRRSRSHGKRVAPGTAGSLK